MLPERAVDVRFETRLFSFPPSLLDFGTFCPSNRQSSARPHPRRADSDSRRLRIWAAARHSSELRIRAITRTAGMEMRMLDEPTAAGSSGDRAATPPPDRLSGRGGGPGGRAGEQGRARRPPIRAPASIALAAAPQRVLASAGVTGPLD